MSHFSEVRDIMAAAPWTDEELNALACQEPQNIEGEKEAEYITTCEDRIT